MNREQAASELVKMAKGLTAGKQKYKNYTIEKSGDNFYVTNPSGHRAFGEVPASVETAKKWIDSDIREKGTKVSSEMVAEELVKMAKGLVESDKQAALGKADFEALASMMSNTGVVKNKQFVNGMVKWLKNQNPRFDEERFKEELEG